MYYLRVVPPVFLTDWPPSPFRTRMCSQELSEASCEPLQVTHWYAVLTHRYQSEDSFLTPRVCVTTASDGLGPKLEALLEKSFEQALGCNVSSLNFLLVVITQHFYPKHSRLRQQMVLLE